MTFEHDDSLEPDPHWQAVAVPALLLFVVSVLHALFMLLGVVVNLADAGDLVVVAIMVLMQGISPAALLVLAALLAAVANRGRTGPLSEATPSMLGGVGLLTLLVALYSFCTCNVIFVFFDMLPVAGCFVGAYFLHTRPPPE